MASYNGGFQYNRGAIVRGDSSKKNIALVFTGDEFADGGMLISKVLKAQQVNASFFFTGRFYRNKLFKKIISRLIQDKHYLGAHSDKHLLYCDWKNRDSLLVTRQEFTTDLQDNYEAMALCGIPRQSAPFFLPPYEWYNDSIAKWTKDAGLQLINFTPGTLSNADYTTPYDKNYRSSKSIWNSIFGYHQLKPAGLNGFILLLHIGSNPARTDKFYFLLNALIHQLKQEGYRFTTIDKLLKQSSN